MTLKNHWPRMWQVFAPKLFWGYLLVGISSTAAEKEKFTHLLFSIVVVHWSEGPAVSHFFFHRAWIAQKQGSWHGRYFCSGFRHACLNTGIFTHKVIPIASTSRVEEGPADTWSIIIIEPFEATAAVSNLENTRWKLGSKRRNSILSLRTKDKSNS